MLYFLEDGLNLAGTLTAANDKIVGKAGYTPGIQQDNITGLLIAGSFYRFMGYF